MRHSPQRARSAFSGAVKALASLLFLPLVILFCASAARAIPITITGGAAGTPPGLGNFAATLTAPNFRYEAADLSGPKQQICGLCAPGSNFPTTIRVRLPETGFLTYNGVTYGPGSNGSAAPDLFITLPSFTIPNDPGTVVSPFTLSGTITVTPFGGGTPFTFELTGSGTATFTFSQSNLGGFRLSTAHFAFSDPAAVPEPATLLLLGTGLAGVAAKVRRRRKR